MTSELLICMYYRILLLHFPGMWQVGIDAELIIHTQIMEIIGGLQIYGDDKIMSVVSTVHITLFNLTLSVSPIV